MTPATSLSPRTQTRQQLDELDALLQKMLALPGSSAEPPEPAPSAALPIPGYLLGLSSTVSPPTEFTYADRPAMLLPEMPPIQLPELPAPPPPLAPALPPVAPLAVSMPIAVSLPPEPTRIAPRVPSESRSSWLPQGVRNLVGVAGLAMIAASVVWAAGERLGWDWTFSS